MRSVCCGGLAFVGGNWNNASKNKLKKFAVREVMNNFEQSVDFIRDLLVNKKYKPSKYYQATIKDGLSKKEMLKC